MPETASQPAPDGITATSAVAETAWGKISRNPIAVRAIDDLVKLGRTQTEIANALGITQSAVSKVLNKYEPRDDLAKRRCKNLALPAVESLYRAALAGEKLGRHGAQVAILQGAGVLGNDRESGPGLVVNIGCDVRNVQVGLITHSAYPDSTLSDYTRLSLSAAIQPLPVTD